MSRARILADYVSSGDELALKAPLASPAFTGTPTGITATHVGLGNVTNESKATMLASPTLTGTTTVSGDIVPSTPLSHRNIFINGAMTVAQRGTSETTVTSTQYANACDRMKIIMSSGGGWTISQEGTGPAGFSNSYKAACTESESTDSMKVYIDSSFEGQDLQHLKKGTAGALATTLSFWTRSTTTGTFIVELFDHDNNRSISKSYTISVADTWEYKTITFAGDTTGAFGNDNNKSLSIYFWLVAGGDYDSGTLNTSWGTPTNANRAVGQTDIVASGSKDWWITGIQLELGSNATPFEHRSYGDELARCQRYYQSAGTESGTTSYPDSSGYSRGSQTFVTEMRATPSMTFTDASSGGSFASHTTTQKGFYVTYGSLSATQAGTFTWKGDSEL